MDFDEIKEKVEILLQKEKAEGFEQELKLKINAL